MLIYNKCRVKEKRARYAANPLDYKKVIADGWVPPNDLTDASADSPLETRPAQLCPGRQSSPGLYPDSCTL